MGPQATALRGAATRLRSVLLRRTTGQSLLLGLGAGVGVLTGLLAAALIGLIQLVQRVAWGSTASPWEILLVPAAGALAVGLLILRWAPEPGGSGIVHIMTAVALHGGRIRARVPFAGLLATGLALGTGASGGREGPIVLIGGGVGSLAGRLFALDEDRKRTLIAGGAAAGIGASFNAPIGGMLFAIELLAGGLQTRSLHVIVIASVAGSVTARQVVGPGITYRPDTTFVLGDPVELVLYAVLSVAAVAVAVAFIRTEELAKRLLRRIAAPLPLRLALGGLGVGAIALLLPEVLGTGDQLPPIDGVREPIQHMLDGGYDTGWAAAAGLVGLLVAKLVATSLSIGSGNAVGSFAPTIFMGAALGAAFGAATTELLPGIAMDPGAFALVGMAAVFSAAARAPLTAILIAFELTGDYGLVLPLMLACGIATFIADRVQPDTLYTLPLRQRGIVYAEPQDVDLLQTVRVGEIMTTDPPTVHARASLPELLDRFAATSSHGFPVVEEREDGPRLVGVVTLTDLGRADRQGLAPEGLTAADLCTRQPLTVTPQDPVFRAVRRMAAIDVGRLPVVAADDHGRLIGLVRRQDVVKAYQRAITRSLGVQHREASSRLRDLTGTMFVELVVGHGAPAAGKAVREMHWPHRTILVSVRRKGEIVMPNGDTVLRPGDGVVVLTGAEAADDVRRLLAGTGEGGD